MKLDVKQRLVLLAILPKEGDFTTLKIVRGLREDLSFTESEHKDLQFAQHDNGLLQWQVAADKEVEIAIGEKATDIIVEALKKLNADRKLTEDHYQLYEKFISE